MSQPYLLGMEPRYSLKVYPRLDKLYTTKGSLNFDMIRTKIFRDRPLPRHHDLMIYLIYAMIGIATGAMTLGITAAEDEFTMLKVKITDDIIGGSSNQLTLGWFFFLFISASLAFIAAILVVYEAPLAAGSGIPEIIGYLNGVNFPKFFCEWTFFIKICGIILAGVAGLCVGKTGTFAHLGAMMGLGMLYLPIKSFEFFHNDSRKREFITAGMSCGIAAAFGSPIGGTLFGFEIS